MCIASQQWSDPFALCCQFLVNKLFYVSTRSDLSFPQRHTIFALACMLHALWSQEKTLDVCFEDFEGALFCVLLFRSEQVLRFPILNSECFHNPHLCVLSMLGGNEKDSANFEMVLR